MRRQILIFLSFLATCFPAEAVHSQSKDLLLFPRDSFTVQTKTVQTSAGEKKVTYRSCMHILYVAKPVQKDYQSLTVSVPVQVNGAPVDASHAPILFVNGVGGYLSVNNARGGGFGMGGPPGGMPPGGGNRGPGGMPPNGGGSGGMPPAGGEPIRGSMNHVSGKADLALAAGYVVVSPGCRGRDNQAADGAYYGKAPAATVDLKAAVRYLRHNKGVLPGNTDWIFSTGVSAGGALSALLGASGNSALFEPYLKALGAAEASDAVFSSACFCPIADFEHADGTYEWMYGSIPLKSGLADQDLLGQLKAGYVQYQAALRLSGINGFGALTADNYGGYLLANYLIPSANLFLKKLSGEQRTAYLEKSKWIKWDAQGASFSFAEYVSHVGRMKGLPAFDDFDMKQPEPNEFGSQTVAARHFTEFSVQHSTGNKAARVGSEVEQIRNLMNPMYITGQKNPGCAKHWWLRQGASDNHTSQTVLANLAASLENQNKNVNMLLYWDAGHGADEDAEDFVAWMGRTTGYRLPAGSGK